MSNLHLIVVPRVSEKTYAQSLSSTYVFNVSTVANKQQIADAVAEQFNVTVTDVRTVVQKGKKIRGVRKGKTVQGVRKNIKKAYVSLKEGDKIPVFDAMEEKK
jgi:large subunit ribosomal protein L23